MKLIQPSVFLRADPPPQSQNPHGRSSRDFRVSIKFFLNYRRRREKELLPSGVNCKSRWISLSPFLSRNAFEKDGVIDPREVYLSSIVLFTAAREEIFVSSVCGRSRATARVKISRGDVDVRHRAAWIKRILRRLFEGHSSLARARPAIPLIF